MAPSSDADEPNDVALSDPLMDDTTATKKRSLNSSTGTLKPQSSYSIVTLTLPPPLLPTLPFELILEILSRLPVKSLMQFQCVCKSWKSLISDPNFAKKHLRVSTTRHHVLLSYIPNPSREFVLVDYPFSSVFTELTAAAATQLDFPLPNANRYHVIVGSCHGIICFELDHNFALLWNPSIRKFMKLPSLENPSYTCTAYGFGYVYDHFNDNYIYKVAAAVNYYDVESDYYVVYKTQVKVYTLGTNSWRMIQDFPYGVPEPSGRFVSGTLNWLASDVSVTSWVIVSLDLDKESYQEIMPPDYGVESMVTRTLVVLRNCLSILVLSCTFSDVWLMNEYGNTESWTKLFRIPHSYIRDLEALPYIKPLYLSEDDQVLLQCDYELQSKHRTELAIYNSRDSTFKTTEIQNINYTMVHEVYQESLIMPCS